MNRTCTQCSAAFEITPQDLAFYDKVSPEFGGKKYAIPPPTMCPACRRQHRFTFRNEWSFYHRKCDLTQKQIISIYPPDSSYTVYDQHVWWTDAYDPLAFGKDIDFQRPFFEQLNELHRVVPKSSIQNAKSENCDYTNYSAENKDCYLLVGGLGAEKTLYSYRVFYSTDVVDSFDLHQCEQCYQCLESSKLYNAVECRRCHDCSDITLSADCHGCRNCFGCVGLRNKEFHMFNEKLPEEEYRKRIKELSTTDPEYVRKIFTDLLLQTPHRFAHIVQSERCSGDQLLQCSNVHDSYTVKHSQDMKYGSIAEHDKDCMDVNFTDNCELSCNCTNQEKNYHTGFSALLWYSKHCWYSLNCFHSNNLFGCSGMKGNSYCILNKQYTKEEYETLVPKIIEHMRKTPLRLPDGSSAGQEWGEFPPPSLSPFDYNESLAFEEFPMSKEDVLARSGKWRDEEEKKDQYLGPSYDVPKKISDVADDITKSILRCEITSKPYKIIPQELKFYREMQLPIPRKCPDQRHKERMALRNPRKLWNRQCAKCQKEIQTTYAPERPEIVYCEECYLASVY